MTIGVSRELPPPLLGPGTGEIVLLLLLAEEEEEEEAIPLVDGAELVALSSSAAGTGTGSTGITSPLSLIFFIRIMKLRLPH